MTVKSIASVCILLVLAVLALPLTAHAQATSQPVEHDDWQKKRSKAAEAEAKARRARIDAECAELKNHAWAGTYYYGFKAGLVLHVAPNAGFLFESFGCMGVSDRNYGPVEAINEYSIRLKPSFSNSTNGIQGISEQLIPVSWGDRRYLLAPHQMLEFFNDVNRRVDVQKGVHGFYFLRKGDEVKDVQGLPAVPPEYRQFVLTSPRTARITSISALYPLGPEIQTSIQWNIPIEIEFDGPGPAWVGMLLDIDSSELQTLVSAIEVTEVTGNRAIAKMWLMAKLSEAPNLPGVGTKFITGPRFVGVPKAVEKADKATKR